MKTTILLTVAIICSAIGVAPKSASAQGGCQVCIGYMQRKPVSINGKAINKEAAAMLATGASVDYHCELANGIWPSYLHCETYLTSCTYWTECAYQIQGVHTSLDGRVDEADAVAFATAKEKAASTRRDCQGRIIARHYSRTTRAALERSLAVITI